MTSRTEATRSGERPSGGAIGRPIVQVSVDVPTAEEAVQIAEMALRAGVDWLEVGTPLILFQGLPTIARMAQAFPDSPIFADIKIVDGARKYVVAAAEHGAHYVSVCGVASDASIRQAAAGGRDTGIKVVVDLYASTDPVTRAREVVAMGADLVYVHFGGDSYGEAPARDDTARIIPLVKAAVDVPVGAVSFDVASGIAAAKAGADIVLIGHPYLRGPEAESMLTDYVRQVKAAGA
jgi:3-hexulose-6-phosphate synthase/6-phospho-3-hexuloisomerase